MPVSSSTQKFTDIFDITNNLLILNNGSISQIIKVGTINFGLLSEEEQDAAIYAYAGILNSLNFPIQIVVKSHAKDISGYLDHLARAEEQAINPNHKAQIARYREFVRVWVKNSNILDKDFYLVITASAFDLGIGGTQSALGWGSSGVNLDRYELAPIIERANGILNPMRDHMINQFGRIGLYAHQITTQDIIKLFYQSYNPNDNEGLGTMETQNFTAPIISASVVESKFE